MAQATRKIRTIRLVRSPRTDGVGVACIESEEGSQFYTFREIRCDIGGRGFAIHRLGLGDVYHVRVGTPEEMSCECMGFLRWSRCKHVSALSALIREGDLPASEQV